MKLLFFLLTLTTFATSCGGGTADFRKQLIAITVTPASAGAQDFLNASSSGLAHYVAGGLVGTSEVFATAPANRAVPISQMTMLTQTFQVRRRLPAHKDTVSTID